LEFGACDLEFNIGVAISAGVKAFAKLNLNISNHINQRINWKNRIKKFRIICPEGQKKRK